VLTTWCGIRIVRTRYLEEADEGRDEVHMLPRVVRLPFVRAGEGDSKDFGLARNTSAYKDDAMTGSRRTLDASTARSSVSGHFLPTEKMLLVFSLELRMKPFPLLDPVRTLGLSLMQYVDLQERRDSEEDVARLLTAVLGVLPDLEMEDE
jgi:hypothetical protein